MNEQAESAPGSAGKIALLADLLVALRFLTRLPLPLKSITLHGNLARSMRVFPLAGALVGLVGGIVYGLAYLIFPASLAALLAVAATILLTGGLHEDGLADMADGLGGMDRTERLAFMKDSRIGAYGVLALLLGILTKTTALSSMAGPEQAIGGLIAAHALARAAIPVAMLVLHPAAESGLGVAAGRPDISTAGIAGTLGLLLAALVLSPGAALAAGLAAALGAAAALIVAWRKFGGYTGDVLGAIEQAAEIAALLGITAASL